jgi:hypothetical protein
MKKFSLKYQINKNLYFNKNIVQNNDLVKFIDFSSKLIIEAQSYRKQLVEMTTQLKSLFIQLKNLVQNRRLELLRNPIIIGRRKWFESRIPDITQINFKLKPIKNESKTKEITSALIDNEVSYEVPKFVSRHLLFNYSFKLMDISTAEYIAPSGSMEDSLLFSPIETTNDTIE